MKRRPVVVGLGQETYAELERSVLAGTGIDLSPLEACMSTTRTKLLNPLAVAFASNMTGVRGLLALPEAFAQTLGLTVLYVRDLAYTVSYKLGSQILQFYNSVGIAQDLLAQMRKSVHEMESVTEQLDSEFPSLDDLTQLPAFRAKLLEKFREEDQTLQAALAVLLSSVTTGAWTAFECLATDVWVASLNARPTSLANRALRVTPSDSPADGITGKQVSVQMLAKHGFDLRACMGSVLKPKFDLTSLANIRKAYSDAFGKDARLEAIFASPDLNLLEASRHLIVHRAGIVDEEFSSRTKTLGLHYSKGAALPLSGEIVSRLANAAIDAGCKLLFLVDDWLVTNPA